MSRVRIAVLFGGRSSEHDISAASARSVIDALDPDRYDVVPIAIGRDGRWQLEASEALALVPGDARPLVPAAAASGTVAGASGRRLAAASVDGRDPGAALDLDVVFPVLHGPFGEDGTIQGLLEVFDVPYVGSGVLGSALAMDKHACKAVLRDAGIRVAASVCLRLDRDLPDDPRTRQIVEARFAYPVFVKPARLGSSVGISKVHGADELPGALALAFRHDDKVLVEECLVGREVECGVLGNDEPVASAVGEILPHAEWYDFDAKYRAGGSDIAIPADLPPDVAGRIGETAVEAFRACECAGMARVDFFLLDDGALVVNEINTIPGFTETSVYARLFAVSGVPYPRLLDRLVELARERHARSSRLAH